MKLSKNQLKQIRYFFEYLLAIPFFLMLKPFNLKQKGKFGMFLGEYVMYPILKWKQKKRYNILKKNIGIIYKEKFTPLQEDKIIKEYCSNTVKIFTESLGHKQMTKQWLKKNVQTKGIEKLVEAHRN